MPVSVDLGDVLEDYLNQLVASGRYNSKSEVLREGLRLIQDREMGLAAAIESAGARSRAMPADDLPEISPDTARAALNRLRQRIRPLPSA